MRGIAIFLAIVLAVPPTLALIHFAPIERWETPPGAGPQLTPPNPAAGGWPPYLRRSPTAPSPTPTQTTGVARILVLLIQFSDTAANPSHDGAYFNSHLNATGGSDAVGRVATAAVVSALAAVTLLNAIVTGLQLMNQ